MPYNSQPLNILYIYSNLSKYILYLFKVVVNCMASLYIHHFKYIHQFICICSIVVFYLLLLGGVTLDDG